MKKIECAYCRRLRTNNEPCPGCGQTEIEERQSNDKMKFEFYRDGYFIKIFKEPATHDEDIFFFRGDKLVERLRINFRTFMHLREARGVSDGEDDFFLVWEMFEEAQKGKFGVVKAYENDPKYKRIDVRIVPWGYEVCNAVSKINGNCRNHGGVSRYTDWQGIGGVPPAERSWA